MSQSGKKSGGLEEAFKRQKEAGDMVSRMLAMEADFRKMRGEFSEFRHKKKKKKVSLVN